jgi:hypothetical protein
VRRVFNPLAMRFGIGGTATLAVPRRRRGGTQTVPVIPIDLDGARYLVSTRGESDWVRNLRAAGRGELRTRQGVETFRATEVTVDRRGPILSAYQTAGGTTVKPYFAKLPDPADHPVFRIEPVSSG